MDHERVTAVTASFAAALPGTEHMTLISTCAPQLFDAVANQSIANLAGTGMA
jgi:hypothetical protein